MQDKKLIIFDLDGTLIDSGPDLALAINHMLQTLNHAPFSQAMIHTWVGNGALTLVTRALEQAQAKDNVEGALEIFMDFYAQNLCTATRCYPHVKATLATLKEKSYTLAIVTNKPFAFVAPILKGLELEGLFSLILGGDSLAEKKPSAMPLLHVCETLKFSLASAVMIGDSKNDILAAQACKMHNIGLSYGYNYDEDLSSYAPDVLLDDFSDLLKYF